MNPERLLGLFELVFFALAHGHSSIAGAHQEVSVLEQLHGGDAEAEGALGAALGLLEQRAVLLEEARLHVDRHDVTRRRAAVEILVALVHLFLKKYIICHWFETIIQYKWIYIYDKKKHLIVAYHPR